MDGLAPWVGMGLVVVTNLVALAFSYGRLSAKVEGLQETMKSHAHDVDRRVTELVSRIESIDATLRVRGVAG